MIISVFSSIAIAIESSDSLQANSAIGACNGRFRADCGLLDFPASCTNLLTDPLNCGSCYNKCQDGERCRGGVCVAEACNGAAMQLCGILRTCVNLMTDPLNCGTCGEACTQDQECRGGDCVAATNPRDRPCLTSADCPDDNICTSDVCTPDGGCYNPPIPGCCRFNTECEDFDICTENICNMVTHACEYPPIGCEEDGDACTVDTCISGIGCVHPLRTCDDFETSTVDTCDPITGCVFTPISCPDGTTDCDEACADTQTDTNNCGACDVTCTADASKHVTGVACIGGACVITSCLNGWDDCDEVYSNGCEIQINDADVNNCGACNNYCPGGRTCDNGVCSQCPTGQTDCDGVCVDTQTDTNNCGACGNYCPGGRTCDNGECSQCPAGQTDCGGVCVDTQTDTHNCGACDNSCSSRPNAGGAVCNEGRCVCPYPCNGEPYCGMLCINGDCWCPGPR